MMNVLDRNRFLQMTIAFECSLVLVAMFLGWLTGVDPLEHLRFDRASLLEGVVVGALGTIPLFLAFLISRRLPIRSLQEIRTFLQTVLGGPLAACRWYELLLLGFVAGFSEEVLFRGTLQPWLEQGSFWIGVILCNLLFGLAHAVTPVYAVLACLIGLYLSLMLDATSERNLLTPILVHGLYDALAFGVVAAETRRDERGTPGNPGRETPETGDPHPEDDE